MNHNRLISLNFFSGQALRNAVLHVASRIEHTKKLIKCDISQPEGWEYGVFFIKITLSPKIIDVLRNLRPKFPIPKLQDRLFRKYDTSATYIEYTDQGLMGTFVNGAWECIVQTNGVPEEKNLNSMAIVEDNLVAAIIQEIEKGFW